MLEFFASAARFGSEMAGGVQHVTSSNRPEMIIRPVGAQKRMPRPHRHRSSLVHGSHQAAIDDSPHAEAERACRGACRC